MLDRDLMTCRSRITGGVVLVAAMSSSWSCASSTNADSSEADIIGARHVSKDYLPATATIYTGPDLQGRLVPSCGGALVAPGWVLTSASCCIERRPAFVVIGRADLANAAEGQELPVRGCVTHPEHLTPGDGSSRNDVALISLTRNASSALGLLLDEDLASETQLDAVGWGYRGSDGSPTALLGFAVETIDRTACEQDLSLPIDSNMLCTRRKTTASPSLAPRSGSALWDRRGGRHVLAGIYAFTTSAPDAPQRPQVYMNVASYAPWIVSVTHHR